MLNWTYFWLKPFWNSGLPTCPSYDVICIDDDNSNSNILNGSNPPIVKSPEECGKSRLHEDNSRIIHFLALYRTSVRSWSKLPILDDDSERVAATGKLLPTEQMWTCKEEGQGSQWRRNLPFILNSSFSTASFLLDFSLLYQASFIQIWFHLPIWCNLEIKFKTLIFIIYVMLFIKIPGTAEVSSDKSDLSFK